MNYKMWPIFARDQPPGDVMKPFKSRGWPLFKRSTFPTFSAYWPSSVTWLGWLYVDPDLAGSAPGSSGCRNEEIQWEKSGKSYDSFFP